MSEVRDGRVRVGEKPCYMHALLPDQWLGCNVPGNPRHELRHTGTSIHARAPGDDDQSDMFSLPILSLDGHGARG